MLDEFDEGGGLLAVFLVEGEGVHAGTDIVELQGQGRSLMAVEGLLYFFAGDIEEHGVVQRDIAVEGFHKHGLVTGVGVGVDQQSHLGGFGLVEVGQNLSLVE